MDETFSQALREHLARYPLMEPQDCVKLAYQSALGPGHGAPDRGAALAALLEELGSIPPGGTPRPPEEIGNGLCRLYLEGLEEKAASAPLLAELFCKTARETAGTAEKLESCLAAVEAEVPAARAFIEAYRRRGCPAVHHSAAYRAAYRPHYRVVRTVYGGYFPALLETACLLETGAPALVAIDGRCGSGKSGLGELMEQLFDCNVLHMDDYYLPPALRAEDWELNCGGNMDFDRLRREALEPAAAGESIQQRAFDCAAGVLEAGRMLPPKRLTVVEGSYSQHPLLADRYALKIFLTCDPEIQRGRLARREGGRFAAYEARWIPLEEQYFRLCGTERGADLVIDTGGLF